MSLSYRLARPLVRPLVGTGITPNHLTTLRLVTGLVTCALLVAGDRQWTWWAGWAWLLTVFLDAADGELARIGNMATPAGHDYDYAVDNAVNSAFFLAAGIGLRNAALGNWAIGLGIVAGLSVLLSSLWSEAIERRQNFAKKAYDGALGFDLEELLYLMAPLAWLDWLLPVVIGAAIGGSVMMTLTGWRLWRLSCRSHPRRDQPR
jgi:phosphatidylglycerophosphate synthase